MQSRGQRRAARYDDPQAGRGKRSSSRAAVAISMLVFGGLALVGLVGLIVTVGLFAIYSQGLPPTSDLERIQFGSDSVVFDRTDKIQLATFGTAENREPVTFDQVPPILIDAITSTEDKSFWTNSGVDPVGIMSAMLDTIRGRERGASTITQQLVRQRLLDRARHYDRDAAWRDEHGAPRQDG